jgi:hypothetical protein
VPVEIWPDILAGALARCFEPSERRKPIDRNPSRKLAKWLKQTGKQWDPVRHYWKARLREELDLFKAADKRLRKFTASNYAAVAVVANSAEHDAIGEETADAIYSSLPDDAAREIVLLLGLGHSAREIERRTGCDRGKVARILCAIEKTVGETDLVSHNLESPSISPFAEAEYFPRSHMQGPPIKLRASGSTDWTINRDLARLLPPREAKPYRVSRTPGELAAGRAEVKQAVANIEAREKEIKSRENWLRAQLDHLDPELASLGAMEVEFARRGLKPTKRANRAATAPPAAEEGVAA